MDGLVDLRTGPGLRQALTCLPSEGGWSGPLGRRVLEVVGEHCARLAPLVERRTGQPADPHRSADLTSRAWELMATHSEMIIHASNPWGYLTRCVLTAGVNAAIADKLLVRDATVQGGCAPTCVSPERLGYEFGALDRAAGHAHRASGDMPLQSGWDSALRQLHTDLVRAGAPATATANAINRVIDLAATHRRGHREAAVKQDRVLAGIGLSAGQTTALLALVAGTRRGGAKESLWARRRVPPRDSHGRFVQAVTPAVRARMDAYVQDFHDARSVPA